MAETITYHCIDTETSGLDDEKNGLLEVAVVSTDANGKLLDIFHSFSNPLGWGAVVDKSALYGDGLPPVKTKYGGNGIREEQIPGFPLEDVVMTALSEYFQSFAKPKGPSHPDDKHIPRLVFHNESFDVPFLKHAFNRTNRLALGRMLMKSAREMQGVRGEKVSPCDLSIFRRVLDTISGGFFVLQEQSTLSQQRLGEVLNNVNRRPHSGLADAIQLSHNFHDLRKRSEAMRNPFGLQPTGISGGLLGDYYLRPLTGLF